MAVIQHPNLIEIDHNVSLIRYLDLDKFDDLLKTSSLFFCRMDKFDDPYEGSVPKKEYEYRKATATPQLSELHKRLKKFTLLNCWQISSSESDAMWKTYLRDYNGLAIQISTEKLFRVLDESKHNFLVSKVRYIDYDNDIWYHKDEYRHFSYNTYTPIVHKRIQFSSENEFRIIHEIKHYEHTADYWINSNNSTGLKINLKIIDIIEKVILPPKNNIYIRKEVESILKKYNIKLDITESKMNKPPLF